MRRKTLVIAINTVCLLSATTVRSQELRIMSITFPQSSCITGTVPPSETCDSGDVVFGPECVDIPTQGCQDVIDRAEALAEMGAIEASSLLLQGELGDDGSETFSVSEISFTGHVQSTSSSGSFSAISEMRALIRIVPSFPEQSGVIEVEWDLDADIWADASGDGVASTHGKFSLMHVEGPGIPPAIPPVNFIARPGQGYERDSCGSFLAEVGQVYELHFRSGASSFAPSPEGEEDPEDSASTHSEAHFHLSLPRQPFLEFRIVGSPGDAVRPAPGAQLILRGADGEIIDSWSAFSGADFPTSESDPDCSSSVDGENSLNNPHFAEIASVGPIPPGRYRVRPRGTNPWRPDWYPIDPLPGTSTHGRRGFYVHGVDDFETQGSIGLAPELFGTFRGLLDADPGEIRLIVSYEGFSRPDLRFDSSTFQESCLGRATYNLASPADVYLKTGENTDEGYVTGFDPALGEVIQDIDGSTYTGPDSEPEVLTRVYIPGRNETDRLTLFPDGDGGAYTLDVTVTLPDGSEVTARRQSTIARGEVTELAVELSDVGVELRAIGDELSAQMPGDCNQDGRLDLSDGICLLGHLFQGNPAELPCGDTTVDDPGNRALVDTNGDQRVDLSDGIYVFTFLFLGGPPPVLGQECVSLAGCPSACGTER
jgi:hypothetical protein